MSYKRVSLNQRIAHDAQGLSDIEVMLFEVSYADWDAPLRLSTDNTERLSKEPLSYGTRSTWGGADPASEPFLFIVADALVPDNVADRPTSSKVALKPLDAQYAQALRSFTDLASVNMALVWASDPSVIVREWQGLNLMSAGITDGDIVLSLTREAVEEESFPPDRMSRDKCPGLKTS